MGVAKFFIIPLTISLMGVAKFFIIPVTMFPIGEKAVMDEFLTHLG